MNDSESLMQHCLYFTANSLARVITRMAEEEFRKTGLSPSHAFLLMLVSDNPGINQKDLGRVLQLAPSTVTRFIDSMAHKGFVNRKSRGKSSQVFPTRQGENLIDPIKKAWKSLHRRYTRILGEPEGDELADRINRAGKKLSRSV